jgi:hypothetical protein
MKALGLYTTDANAVRQRVSAAGMAGVFVRPIADIARLESQAPAYA